MLYSKKYFKNVVFLTIFSVCSIANASSDCLEDEMLGVGYHSNGCNDITVNDLTYFKGDIVASSFRTIEKLSMSGSQQYTIAFLKEEITKKIVTDFQRSLSDVIFIDLREEPHFMLGCNTTVAIEGQKPTASGD